MIYMTSDNIVADFIQSNLDTIPYINYREIDLTNKVFKNKLSTSDNDTGIEYMKFVIGLRNDGLDEIVSNNGFYHQYGVWYYTTDNYVYSYDIVSLCVVLLDLSAIYFIDEHDVYYFKLIFFLLLLHNLPIYSYFYPLYDKRLGKDCLNYNFHRGVLSLSMILYMKIAEHVIILIIAFALLYLKESE